MSSTTAVMETQFTKQFTEFRSTVGDDAMTKLRDAAFAYFESVGFPTVHEEDWKYTNVASQVAGQWTIQTSGNASVDERASDFDYKQWIHGSESSVW
ncbi:MAG: hypothetical protein IPP63_07370 [Chloracidobacterium sp.]|nr:hypothetical protein [Chloracidobacterium sp.]